MAAEAKTTAIHGATGLTLCGSETAVYPEPRGSCYVHPPFAMRVHLPILSIAGLLVLEGLAHAQPSSVDALIAAGTPGGLTSDQVALRARATSYNAAAQRAVLAQAEARLDQALVAYFPRLTLSATYQRNSRVPAPAILSQEIAPAILDYYSLSAGLVVPISDYALRLSQSYAAASRSAKAAALDARAARLASGLDGRVAYFTWLRARAQANVALRNLETIKAHLADANNAFQVGTASKADVMSAEAQVAKAELVAEQTRGATAAAEDQIRIAMHDTTARPYVVGEDLRVTADAIGPTEKLEALRAEALDKRLEVRALDETRWSLGEQAKAARAGQYPRLDAFGDVLYANPNARMFPQEPVFKATWDVGLRLTYSPNDTFSSGAGRAEADARAAQIEAQKAALADSVRLEVIAAHQALATANVAVRTTARALAAAEESYRVRHELYRNGRATNVELLDAESALFQAGFDLVNARADLRIAQARLRHAVGRDVADLGPP
jgi:outer membrane protein TolC